MLDLAVDPERLAALRGTVTYELALHIRACSAAMLAGEHRPNAAWDTDTIALYLWEVREKHKLPRSPQHEVNPSSLQGPEGVRRHLECLCRLLGEDPALLAALEEPMEAVRDRLHARFLAAPPPLPSASAPRAPEPAPAPPPPEPTPEAPPAAPVVALEPVAIAEPVPEPSAAPEAAPEFEREPPAAPEAPVEPLPPPVEPAAVVAPPAEPPRGQLALLLPKEGAPMPEWKPRPPPPPPPPPRYTADVTIPEGMLEAWSDGSAEDYDQPGGAGWIVEVGGVTLFEGRFHMESASNNFAEGVALGCAIETLAEMLAQRGSDETACVYSDSDFMVSSTAPDNDYVIRASERLYGLILKLREKRRQHPRIRVEHRPGHNKDTEHGSRSNRNNERADRIAGASRWWKKGEAMKVPRLKVDMDAEKAALPATKGKRR